MTSVHKSEEGLTVITTVLKPEIVAKANLPAILKLLNDLSSDQPLSVIIADVLAMFA